jgi:hypothetical protein
LDASAVEWNARRVGGKTGKLRVRTRLGEYLGVVSSNHASSLTLERTRHDGGPAGLLAACNDFVDELN